MPLQGVQTYRPSDVTLSISGLPAYDWTKITIKPATLWAVQALEASALARTLLPDRSSTIMLEVPRYSNTNTVMSGFYNLATVGIPGDVFPIAIIDISSGSSTIYTQCFIEAPAEQSYDNAGEPVYTWTIRATGGASQIVGKQPI